ncbi:hypothetical protein [Shewanella colwelliana]|uniref:hypothetical protein n=1 Tax=Shewanella colwelliana TaxID=23 RepID=UPI0022B0641B|nr:hypothetical protein [Shewanella colwelliana]MCZ4339151.1 hypothetical protein [Shewanella colwelliana]
MSAQRYHPLTSIIALSLCCVCVFAADPDQPITETHTLPQNVALDSEGNPIAVPTGDKAALNYHAAPVQSVSQPITTKHLRKSKPKKRSRKQQLASRDNVADNPSCRWLNKRMHHLEKTLKTGNAKQFGYQYDELQARQSEWVCMKCGAEGPNQDDHNRCQYRR